MPDDTLVIQIVGSRFKNSSGEFTDTFPIPTGTTKIKFESSGQVNLWVDKAGFLTGATPHQAIGFRGDRTLSVKSGLANGDVCNFDVGQSDPFGTKKREIHPCMIIEDT